jgi:hypothetical protein
MPTPNFLKYSTTPDSSGIKAGNYTIGVFSGGTYGPTSTTNYWNGVTPPISGYTIYENKVANGPSIRVPSNSTVLIDYANRLYSGSSISTEAGALSYFNSLGSVICVNRNYEEIITSGLTTLLDAGFTPSYPKSGTTWTDLSFGGNNGTLTNGPTYSPDNGGSIVFDGTNDYVSILNNTTVSFTIGCWINTTATSFTGSEGYEGNGIVWSDVGGIANDFVLSILNNKASWFTGDNTTTINGTTTINTGSWFYITVVKNGTNSTKELFINGISESIGTSGTSTLTANPNIIIGGNTLDSRYFNGKIAQVKIYNRVLSESEILQNYNSQINRFIPTTTANLVFNLDGANYSALPTNGSTVAGTGSFPITMTNANSSMAWNSSNGGVFRKSTSNTSDLLLGGPNYSSGSQPYTVFMAYKWDGGTAGRLLNANSASPDWLLGLWGSSGAKMDIAFNGAFVGSSTTAADTSWHFIWLTDDGLNTTNSTKSYIATNTAPSTTNGTRTGSSGFNGLRLFGRYVNATTSSEPVTGDVGFVKVWDGALTLSEIQSLHAFYKSRFGY